jgi:hypothetical protein
MTVHIIRAGAIGVSAEVVWYSRTGQLTGDPMVVQRAKRMQQWTGPLPGDVAPIDWEDETIAVAAVLEAASSVYGTPVDHFAYPEEGDPILAAPLPD